MPPAVDCFTPLFWVNDLTAVLVRVVLWSLNWILASVTSPCHGAGTFDRSGFLAEKSRLSAAIWLLICASEMFCSVV